MMGFGFVAVLVIVVLGGIMRQRVMRNLGKPGFTSVEYPVIGHVFELEGWKPRTESLPQTTPAAAAVDSNDETQDVPVVGHHVPLVERRKYRRDRASQTPSAFSTDQARHDAIAQYNVEGTLTRSRTGLWA